MSPRLGTRPLSIPEMGGCITSALVQGYILMGEQRVRKGLGEGQQQDGGRPLEDGQLFPATKPLHRPDQHLPVVR